MVLQLRLAKDELAVHIGILLQNQPLIAVVMLVAGAIAAFGTAQIKCLNLMRPKNFSAYAIT